MLKLLTQTILILCFINPLLAKDFVILQSRNAGMFSVFFDVLNLLQSYEMGIFQGIKVDFQYTGPYYDSKCGGNWWEYYFEPISLSDPKDGNVIVTLGDRPYIDPAVIEFANSREENHAIIKRHIRIKPHIQNKIDDFIRTHFQNNCFLIGVHYRGTDKISETAILKYAPLVSELNSQIEQLAGAEYKIFAAADETPFIDFLESQFPGRVCSTSAHRSSRMGRTSPTKSAAFFKMDIKLERKLSSIASSFQNAISFSEQVQI